MRETFHYAIENSLVSQIDDAKLVRKNYIHKFFIIKKC